MGSMLDHTKVPKTPHELGVDASWANVPIADCPYDRVTEHHAWLAWRRGWLTVEVEATGLATGVDRDHPDILMCPTEEDLARTPAPVELPLLGGPRKPREPLAGLGGYSGPGCLPPPTTPPPSTGNRFKDEQSRPWRDDRNDPYGNDWDSEGESWRGDNDPKRPRGKP
jgi:hypothetical protein